MPCLQGQSPASAGKDPGRFHRLEECEKAGLESGPREWCEELHTCHSCTAHQGCRWESEKVGKCRQSAKSAAQVAPSAGGSVDEEPGESTKCDSSFCLRMGSYARFRPLQMSKYWTEVKSTRLMVKLLHESPFLNRICVGGVDIYEG